MLEVQSENTKLQCNLTAVQRAYDQLQSSKDSDAAMMVQKFENETSIIRNELVVKTQELARLEESKDADIDKFISKLREANETKADLSNKLSLQDEKNTVLTAQLNAFVETNTTLKNDLAAKTSSLEDTIVTVEEQNQKISLLQSEFHDIEAEKLTLRSENTTLQSSLTAVQLAYDQLQSSKDSDAAMMVQKFENETSTIRNELLVKTQELALLEESKAAEIDKFQSQMREANETKAELGNKLSLQDEKNTVLTAQLNAFEETITTLQNDLAAKTSSLEDTIVTVEEQNQKISLLQSEFHDMEAEKLTLQSENTTLQSSLTAVQLAYDQLQSSKDSDAAMMVQKFENETSIIRNELLVKTQELALLEESKAAEIDKFQSQMREANETKAELGNKLSLQDEKNTVLTAQLNAFEETITTLQNDLAAKTSSLEDTIVTVEEQNQKISLLQSEFHDIEAEKLTLRSENTTLQSSLTAVQLAYDQLQSSKDSDAAMMVQKFENETSTIRNELLVKTQELALLEESKAAEIDKFQSQMREANETKAELGNKLSLQDEKNTVLTAQLNAFEETITTLQNDLAAKTSSLEDTIVTVEEQNQKISLLQSEFHDIEAEKLTLQSENTTLQSSLTAVQLAYDQLQSSKDSDAAMMVQKFENETSIIRNELLVKTQELALLEESKAAEIDKFQSQMREANETKAELGNKLSLQDEKNTVLTAQLNALEETNANLQNELTGKTSSLEETIVMVEEQNHKIGLFQAEFQDIEAEKLTLKRKFETLTVENTSLTNDISKLESTLKNEIDLIKNASHDAIAFEQQKNNEAGEEIKVLNEKILHLSQKHEVLIQKLEKVTSEKLAFQQENEDHRGQIEADQSAIQSLHEKVISL